ncbi:MAG: hypothetical protein QW422_07405 [Sulfolobales archaeon]
MKNTQTKYLSTTLALVMVVSILASAVAMWYDTLKIHATIETGEVDVEFGEVSCTETPEAEGKDVGSCSVELVYGEEEGPDDDDLDLVITISNAYPGYSCTIYFTVVNVGTIPVKGPFTGTDLGTFPASGELDLNEDGKADVKIYYNLPVTQIDPEGTRDFSITIEVLQPSPESSELEFQLYLYFVQWNEVPTETPA